MDILNQKPADSNSYHLAPHEYGMIRFWKKVSRPDALNREVFVQATLVIHFSVLDRGKHYKSLNSNSHSKSLQDFPEENSAH